MDKRNFLKASAGLGLGLGLSSLAAAQPQPTKAEQEARLMREREKYAAPKVPHRKIKTTKLFRSPEGFPNGLAVTPEGLWIAEQRTDDGQGVSNNAYLVDWHGKVLRKVENECKNTSGLAYGNGSLWMGANAKVEGVFQVDPMTGRTISHRQIPLGPTENGGGCHGVTWHEGKLWLTALRLHGVLRVDAASWQPEFMIPYTVDRSHATAWDNGSIWMVTGSLNGPSLDDDSAGLIRYDATTGRVLETAEFNQSEVDPHGITMHEGVMYGCDASIHPLWPDQRSPSSGYVFRIDFV
jgi:hypothetical protein